MSEKFLNKLLIFSLVIFIFSISFLIYTIYFKTKPLSGIKINFSGINEVISLEDYNYQIEITNNSNKKLFNTNLKIQLSEGAYSKDNLQQKEFSIFIGDLDIKQTFKKEINLFFVNKENTKENINLTFNYQLENKKYTFSEEKNFEILIKSSPIKVQILSPSKIYLNQQFQTNLKIINITQQQINNIKIFLEQPSNYVLNYSFPKSENFYWEFSYLQPQEVKMISLIGQIQDLKSSGIFSVKVNFNFNNLNFSLPQEIIKIEVLDNPVSLSIKSTPPNKSLPINSTIFYEVVLENKSQTVLENGEFKVNFDGYFDFSTVNSNGFFNILEKTLYFNSRNTPELVSFKPGDKIKFYFSIALPKVYPDIENDKKNFSNKIKFEYYSPTIPVEVEIGTKEYKVVQEDEIKISGDYFVDSYLVFKDKIFNNIGTFPLEYNQPTNLTWHIKIKTIGEDFDNFSLSTKLPAGVYFTGKVGGDALLENVNYDAKTGAFIYNINKLPANLGYTKPEIDLAFQLLVEIPANISISNFVIIPKIDISAIGSFSKSEIKKNINEITVTKVLYQ